MTGHRAARDRRPLLAFPDRPRSGPPPRSGRPRRWARVLDLALLAAVVLSSSLWLADGPSAARTLTTVLALCVAPGWGLIRAAGAFGSLLHVVQAVALSVSLVMLTGLLLVTRLGWDWELGVNVLNLAAVVALTAALLRPDLAWGRADRHR